MFEIQREDQRAFTGETRLDGDGIGGTQLSAGRDTDVDLVGAGW
jgi:hypothetical protein